MSVSRALNHAAGISPCDIVGKVVKRVRKSSAHPALTIDFADETSVQIRVDGYDPSHPGLPKALETDSYLEELILTDEPLDFPLLGCAYVTLSDKAFELRKEGGSEDTLQQWDQQHIGLALKCTNENSISGKARWHCVWASKQELDAACGACTFRSYEDVYLDILPRTQRPSSSTPTKHRRRRSRVSIH